MLNIFKNKVVNNICYVVMIIASYFLIAPFDKMDIYPMFNARLVYYFKGFSIWHIVFLLIFIAGLVLRKYRDKLKNILSVSSLMVVFFSGQKFMDLAYTNIFFENGMSIVDIPFVSLLTCFLYLILFLIIVVAAFGINYMLFFENRLYIYSHRERNIKDYIVPVLGVICLIIILILKINANSLQFGLLAGNELHFEDLFHNRIIIKNVLNVLFILLVVGYYAVQFLFKISFTDKFLFASILTTIIVSLIYSINLVYNSNGEAMFTFGNPKKFYDRYALLNYINRNYCL